MLLSTRKTTFLIALVFISFGPIFPVSARGLQDESLSPAPEAVQAAPRTLKVGTLPAESAIPIILSEENQAFAAEGVDVQIVPFFSPNDRNIAFQAGEIDGFIADIMTAVTFHNAGFPIRITSDINEDFKLLTAPNSGITTFRELDGKDVSLVPGFVLEYIMDVMAEREGITYSTVVIPSIPARFEALLNNQVSAVLFTEPQASLLTAQGAGILAGTKEFGIKAGAMIFSEDTVKNNAEAIKRYYRALDRTVLEINGTDLSEYTDVLTNFGFPPTIKGTIQYSAAAAVDINEYSSVIAWMKQKELLKAEVSYGDIVAEFR